MPLHIPDDCVNLHLVFSLTGDPENMSTAIAAVLSDPLTPDFADICNNVYVAFSGGYGLDNMYDQWSFIGVRAETATGIVAETIIPQPGSGGSLGTAVQNTCMLVKKFTGIAGHKHRGRMYFPPISLADADVNNYGVIDSTPFGVIQTNLDGFFGAFNAADGIDHATLLHTDPGDAVNAIASLQLEMQVATQRRRLR